MLCRFVVFAISLILLIILPSVFHNHTNVLKGNLFRSMHLCEVAGMIENHTKAAQRRPGMFPKKLPSTKVLVIHWIKLPAGKYQSRKEHFIYLCIWYGFELVGETHIPFKLRCHFNAGKELRGAYKQNKARG